MTLSSRSILRRLGFMNTARALRWDLVRLGARLRTRRMLRRALRAGPLPARLHFGSGSKKIPGWLNVDVAGTDVDVDLGSGRLPFADGQFEAAAAQQVVEHLHIDEELLPLLRELHRCLRPGGEIWLSCPDIAKVCTAYMADGGTSLVADKQSRWPKYTTGGWPASHVVNDLFHQYGQHRNLFDLPLLEAVLTRAGFRDVRRLDEAAMRARFPEFPPRRDDFNSLYVRATA
jgi:predicted SAM-dependent methyltransferase